MPAPCKNRHGVVARLLHEGKGNIHTGPPEIWEGKEWSTVPQCDCSLWTAAECGFLIGGHMLAVWITVAVVGAIAVACLLVISAVEEVAQRMKRRGRNKWQ